TESKLSPVDHAVALCTLAKVIAWAGKQEEAYRLALRAAELAPEDPAAQFETGKNAARLGRTQEAIQYLQQALALKPTFVEAHSLLGTVLADAGQMEEAARHCRQAIVLRPADAQLYLNLSSVLRRQRNAEEAARSLRAALRLSPDYAEAHNSLGWLLKDQGQLTEALAHFREAVRLRPGSPPPMIGLAWLLATHPDANARNVSESIRLGQQLVELSAYKNWMSLDTLAAGYAAAGRYPEAVRAAEKALELVQAVSAQDAPAVAERLMLYQQGKPYREPVRPAAR
ncbi:MAG TPA: tetratricopeptide repeat protein, partial [Candidatus Binatia bacterium]|nr:tetratricopeptide repeat protein [Candidatus Binatia bacterium]